MERWLPEATAEGRRLRRAAALDRVLARHLRGAIYSTAAVLSRLFAVPRAEVEAAVARLGRSGVLRAGVEIAGRPGRWVVSV